MDLVLIVLSFFLGLLIFVITIGKIYNDTDWDHPIINILDGWLRLYCKKYHRLGDFQITLPQDKSFILISNHLSAIDPLLLISATDRPVRFMIAKEEYERPVLSWIFKEARCIPVDRSGRVDGAFRRSLRRIEAGELIVIFPQGGVHSHTAPKSRIKSGIIKLSELSGCGILPVRISGIASPGTMMKSVVERSRVRFDVEKVIEHQQVLSKKFRAQLSQWLIFERDHLSL